MTRRHARILLQVLLVAAVVTLGVLLMVTRSQVSTLTAQSREAQQAQIAANRQLAQLADRKASVAKGTAREANHRSRLTARTTKVIVRYLQGRAGLPGAPGRNGVNGARGPAGMGKTGPRGPMGAVGASVTDAQVEAAVIVYCVANGNCAGPQGAPGKDGQNGVNGTNGTNGTDGMNGTNGMNGVSPTVTPIPVGDPTCPLGGALITDSNGDPPVPVCSG